MLNTLQLLHAAPFFLCVLVPSLLCENLRCYYRPILEKGRDFELVVTECPPGELCFQADGRYGNYSALSAHGCMAEEDCGQVHGLRLHGTDYTMSYACCDWPYCNLGVSASPALFTVTLGTVAVMAGSW